MNEKEINSLKERIKTTGNNIFATFKVETISNLIIYYEELQKQNAELEEEIKRCEKANVILDEETTELTGENIRLKALLKLHEGNLKREHYKAHRSEIVAEKQARIDELEKAINKVISYTDRLLNSDDVPYVDAILITIKEILRGDNNG